jgi:hypothetical protein
MSEAGIPPKRAREILSHPDVRTTLAIYTHAMRRKHDDSADKMAEIAGLTNVGNKRETNSCVEPEETELSDCFNGSPGWNRTNDQRINRQFRAVICVSQRHRSRGKSDYLASPCLTLPDAA